MKHRGRGVDGIEFGGRGSGEMRERDFRKAEACGARVTQECGLQHEDRVGGGDAIERCVERRNEERVPKGAAFARTLVVSLQPLLERFGRLTLRRAQRDEGEGAGDAELFAQREERIRCKRFEQLKGCRQHAGA